jgi:beta-phosphoglucomutase-like phosphatase (HAD superfamily)
MPYKSRLLMLAALGSFALAACSSGNDRVDPQIRLLNLSSAFGSLDLYVTGSDGIDRLELAEVSLEEISEYVSLSAGFYDVQLRRSGSATGVRTLSQEQLVRDSYTTYVAHGSTGRRFSTLKIEEDRERPDTDKSSVQVLNVAEAGSLDVYFTEPDAVLDDVSPQFTSLESGGQSSFRDLDSSTYRLRLTRSGSTNELDVRRFRDELNLPAYFDACFFSNEIGHRKPSPRSYQHVLRAFGLAASPDRALPAPPPSSPRPAGRSQ